MKVGIAGWSLHRRFFDKKLSLLDYPALCKEEFGVDGVELNSPFFESLEPDYLDQLKRNAEEAGVQLVSIAVDAPGNLSSLDEEERRQSVLTHLPWGSAAGRLGCISYRANTGGSDKATPEEIAQCIKSFSELGQAAAPLGVKVIIENHGGIARYPEPIVEVVKGVGTDKCGTCPDFGNFEADIRYEALEKVMPYAVVVHAKSHDFDENGNHTEWDLARCVQIVKDSGFDGWLMVEFEGKKDDHDGTLRTVELLRSLI